MGRWPAPGVTVNAIAIEQSEPDLTAYFFENVIRGEGAFVVTAASFAGLPVADPQKTGAGNSRQTAALQHGPGRRGAALQ